VSGNQSSLLPALIAEFRLRRLTTGASLNSVSGACFTPYQPPSSPSRLVRGFALNRILLSSFSLADEVCSWRADGNP